MDTNHEDFEDLRIRKKSANYLSNVLLGATSLGTQIVTREDDLERRLIHQGVAAALFGITIVYNCRTGDVYRQEESKARVQKLLQEIWAVSRYDVPNLSFEKLAQRVEYLIASSTAEKPLNSMFKALVTGRQTDIEYANGWFVDRGKQLKPPVSCPENEKLIAEVKVIEHEVQEYVAEIEDKIRAERAEQKRAKEAKDADQARERDFAAENERARRRQEARDMKEIVEDWGAKKSSVGQRPPQLPDYYQQPSIVGFGNSALTRSNSIVRRPGFRIIT